MEDNTQTFTKPAGKENVPHSTLFNVSLRGWIALIVITTVCAMSIGAIKIEEPLYTLCGMVVAFYFGQVKPPTPPAAPATAIKPAS